MTHPWSGALEIKKEMVYSDMVDADDCLNE